MGSTTGPKLRDLPDMLPLYVLPDDPLAEDVLIPCFRAAASVDSMVGFFSSNALATLAPGLATFFNSSQEHLRLIICPILSESDTAAIRDGVITAAVAADGALSEIIITEDAIVEHTLRCLTWLIRRGRIQIRVALMRSALFHPKVWLFQHYSDVVAVHGSSNMTYAGFTRNVEQLAVSKSWEDENQRYVTERLRAEFLTLWDNTKADCQVVPISEALRDRLLGTYGARPAPTEEELMEIYDAERDVNTISSVIDEARTEGFRIPRDLVTDRGAFAHQGRAVDAWCRSGYRGILQMATGAGKTIAALICARRLYEKVKPLLIVVAAPYVPLIQQWCGEIETFGLQPINLSVARGPKARARELGRIKRKLRTRHDGVEAIVVSHATLANRMFQQALRGMDCPVMLIADEAHNLGSEGFVRSPPEGFVATLGLSATPIRQYDEAGTTSLLAFLGPVVYEYPLSEAIGQCLVEYDYFVHGVYLREEEIDCWEELSQDIRASAWKLEQPGGPDDYLKKLLRDRRAILENAKDKIGVFERIIDRENLSRLSHTLVYTSDKNPGQLRAVNGLLRDRGLMFHQLTYVETANRDKTQRILDAFADGTLRVLTAKRVLDEGVNVPQIRKAFILASTTVERQWIQRRGRLLRRCDEMGKTHSEIHDFVVLPPPASTRDVDAASLVRSELDRVKEFAGLARNAGRPDGPLRAIDEFLSALV